jgi:hypothetical protein
MTDTFVAPSLTTRPNRPNSMFPVKRPSFSLAPLGGMSAQSGAETVFSPWVQLPTEQSVLDLTLAITTLTDGSAVKAAPSPPSAISASSSMDVSSAPSTATSDVASLPVTPTPGTPSPVTPTPAPTGPSLRVTVQTCRAMKDGNPVDAPRTAMGGDFGNQTAAGTVYAQCLALKWVRLQIVVGGASPASAFSVTGTGVALGQS